MTTNAWPRSSRIYAELLRHGGGLATVAQAHRRIRTSVVEALPDGAAAAAAVFGHGDGIEPGLVACFPAPTTSLGGEPFGHCDGARLGFDDGRFVGVQFRRAPAGLPPRGFKMGGR